MAAPAPCGGVAFIADGGFWEIIERTQNASGGRIQTQTVELEHCLAELPAAEIAAFDIEFARHHDELYSWDLWGAAFLLQNGCGDDCFEYFRSWVIAQGRDYFEVVRDDPSALADGRLGDEEEVAEAELLSYVASDTYTRLTGREMWNDYPDHPGAFDIDEPSGEQWEESELEAMFPEITPLPLEY
ncbi:DUF4240 domain-containing protein [Arthrobacter sp. GCM10027362]|uniref:DUF4240 domain-containing protein n=1 Tax=Arthrobacter sp. GCM10027362 TaxID=3273379 RepID=UPI00362E2D9D